MHLPGRAENGFLNPYSIEKVSKCFCRTQVQILNPLKLLQRPKAFEFLHPHTPANNSFILE
jgi:hypothetical protein